MLIHNQLYKIVELNRAVTILLQLVISVLQLVVNVFCKVFETFY